MVITTVVMWKQTKVQLIKVYFAANLERDIIPYGLIKDRVCGISYRGQYRVVASLNNGPAVFEVYIYNNVLVV